MLNYDLSEEHQILRDSIRDFAEKEIKPLAEELDEKEEFSLDLVKKMAEMGLFGMYVSDEYGGSEAGYLSYIIAVEELAPFTTSAMTSRRRNGFRGSAGARSLPHSVSPNRTPAATPELHRPQRSSRTANG